MTLPSGRPSVIGPGTRWLLYAVYAGVAALTATAVYLGGVTAAEWTSGASYQGYVYQWVVLAHLGVGLLVLTPFLLFAAAHALAARRHPNRRAARMGYLLAALGVVVLVTGLALMRVAGVELRQPPARAAAYWLHVLVPFAVAWAFLQHRRRGRRLSPRAVRRWALATAVVVLVTAAADARLSRAPDATGTPETLAPSLARTATGRPIAPDALMDAPTAPGATRTRTRAGSRARTASARSTTRPTPPASGRRARCCWPATATWTPAAGAPAATTRCRSSRASSTPRLRRRAGPDGAGRDHLHLVPRHRTHVNSTRGNADYTIEEPRHYPFAFSANPRCSGQPAAGQGQAGDAQEDVPEAAAPDPGVLLHLPQGPHPGALNHYKDFLRGQNHYDTFLLSGVSGRGARSFYYPPKAEARCTGCHMPLRASSDFGAQTFDGQRRLAHPRPPSRRQHRRPSLRGDLETVAAQQAYLDKKVDARPLRPARGRHDRRDACSARSTAARPALTPGKRYLVEAGASARSGRAPFTQGTADSNEIWVEITVTAGDTVIGRSGGIGAGRPRRPVVALHQRLHARPRGRNGSTAATRRTSSSRSTTSRSRRARPRSSTSGSTCPDGRRGRSRSRPGCSTASSTSP